MNFTVATSIKYGDYKHLKPSVDCVHEMIKDHWRSLCRCFDFNRDVTFHIRPIRGITCGIAYNEENKIEIDPRRKLRCILETIVHELVHMEQYKQGSLKDDFHRNKTLWLGFEFEPSKTHLEYLAEPWEIEARRRAKEYVDRVWPKS
jgi:hypothetical protein